MANQDFDPIAESSWIREDEGRHDHTLVENWLFRLRSERFRSRFSGKVHEYFVAHLADGVHVLAVTDDQHLLMVKQFRAGSGRDSLEPPGGLIEPGEDPRAAGSTASCSKRPATRAILPSWSERSGPTLPFSPCGSPRSSSRKRRIAEPRPDHSEELAIELVPVREIPWLIKTGRIDHAVCVAGLLWWLYLDGSDRSDPFSSPPADRPVN